MKEAQKAIQEYVLVDVPICKDTRPVHRRRDVGFQKVVDRFRSKIRVVGTRTGNPSLGNPGQILSRIGENGEWGLGSGEQQFVTLSKYEDWYGHRATAEPSSSESSQKILFHSGDSTQRIL